MLTVLNLLSQHGPHIKVLKGMSSSPAEHNFWAGVWRGFPNLRKLVWSVPVEFLVLDNLLAPALLGPPATVSKIELSLFGLSKSEWTVQEDQWAYDVCFCRLESLGFAERLRRILVCAPGGQRMGQRGVIDVSHAKLESCTDLSISVSTLKGLSQLHAPKLRCLHIQSKGRLVIDLPELPNLEDLNLSTKEGKQDGIPPAAGPGVMGVRHVSSVYLYGFSPRRRQGRRSRIKTLNIVTKSLVDHGAFQQLDRKQLLAVHLDVECCDLSSFSFGNLVSPQLAGSVVLETNHLRCSWAGRLISAR